MKVAISCSKEHAASIIKKYDLDAIVGSSERESCYITTPLQVLPGQHSKIFAILEKEHLDYQCIER